MSPHSPALLAIDVGNTHTVLGIYRDEALVAHWRVETAEERTADELAVLLRGLMELEGFEWGAVGAGIVSSVVPPAVDAIGELFERHLRVPALVVGPGIKTGMPILYENPREVGADRIVNAVGAYDRVGKGCVVVDFGTATTWDVVTPRGEYLGGVIAPGVGISAEALYVHASKLPRVEIARPSRVIGKNTVASMQAGLLFGYAGMVDAVAARIRAELDFEPTCIATGGLAELIGREAEAIDITDPMLTLRGLKTLYERNC